MSNTEKMPESSQVLEIGGKSYTFQFSRAGIVKMLDCGFDFETVRTQENFLMEVYKKMDIIFMGALWKNHMLPAKDCVEIADLALEDYSIDELFFMFSGLYNAVFIVEGKKIPLAQKMRTQLQTAIEELSKPKTKK